MKIAKMKESGYSIWKNDSNKQKLEKMNIKLLLNFRYLLHSSSTVVGIFSFTDNVFLKYDIPWENCTSLEVEDTFGNVGRHNYHSW